jgi:2-keto-3-deoxy-L-rhamnonate aldolase RhmA
MKGKELREALRAGRRVYGTAVISDSPMWPPAIGAVPGLDFVFLDTEHQAIDRGKLSWMCRVYEGLGLAPIVRIAAHDAMAASTVMDGGARGLIVPYVERPEDVRTAIGAVRYRPVKGALLREWMEAGTASRDKLGEYIDKRNEQSVLIINVESIPSMERLDELLAIPELDAVLIGPHDLSCSLGIPEEYKHPRFISAVDEIIDRARAAGKGAGIHYVFHDVSGLEQEITWARRGANLIVHGADVLMIRFALTADIGRLRRELGDEPRRT